LHRGVVEDGVDLAVGEFPLQFGQGRRCPLPAVLIQEIQNQDNGRRDENLAAPPALEPRARRCPTAVDQLTLDDGRLAGVVE
jgi:hypothetical protein